MTTNRSHETRFDTLLPGIPMLLLGLLILPGATILGIVLVARTCIQPTPPHKHKQQAPQPQTNQTISDQ